MSFDHRVSMFSHSELFTSMHTAQRSPQKKRQILVWKALGTGLLFLWLALFASPALAADVTLAWDPNSEVDVEGYGVYLSQEDPGPPYHLYGYVTLSELSDPGNPSFTINGLENGARYYFAVTAYDGTGNESLFSNSVCADVGDVLTLCPSANVGGGGSGSGGSGSVGSASGGGGGGGGCFIMASATPQGLSSPLGNIFLAFLGCLGAFVWIAERYFKPLFPGLSGGQDAGRRIRIGVLQELNDLPG
jgi:uncharacterized membrane protein YgcG